MKLSVNVEADAINILALSMGRIAVDIDGIELSELIAAINQNGCTLRIADEPGKSTVGAPQPPFTSLPGICCSTAAHYVGRQFAAVCPFASGAGFWGVRMDPLFRLRLPDPPGRVVVSDIAPQTTRTVESLPSSDRHTHATPRHQHCSSGCLWRSAAGICHL